MRLPEADDEAPFAVVKAVLACISEGRHADIASHLTDDFQFELPYGGDFGGPFDKASFDGMQRATFKMFANFRIAPTEVHACSERGKVVVEYESDGRRRGQRPAIPQPLHRRVPRARRAHRPLA